jgi:hypothetical protein
VVADRPAQHWIAHFEYVEHRALGDLTFDVKIHFTIDLREFAQMGR